LLPEIRIDPDDPGAEHVLSFALVRDPKRKIELLRPSRQPDSIEIPLRLAQAWIEAGNYRNAESCLGEVEAKLPGDWRVAWYRGLSLLRRGQPRDALAAFDGVYSDLPGEPAAKLALALSAELAGNDDRAMPLYDLVSRVDPSFATAAFGLGRCLRRAGQRAEAAAAYRRVPQASSLYARAQTALASALASMTPTPPGADDLCQAAAVIEALALEGIEQFRLRAEVLENALALLKGRALLVDPSRLLFGQPLQETPLRFSLENAYRQMARMESDRSRQIALVDKANAVRPWTWF